MRRAVLVVALLALTTTAMTACKRGNKPKESSHVWLGRALGCATYKTGEFACWGSNEGQGPPRAIVLPTKETALGAELPANAGALAIEDHEVCAIVANGRVQCWGQVAYSPIESGALEIAGYCVRRAKDVQCWEAKAGIDLSHGVYEPAPLKGRDVSRIASSGVRTCALFGDGKGIGCWDYDFKNAIAPVLAGVDVKSITVGAEHACALLADRSVQCWGKNADGQLGDGTTTDATTPVTIHGLGDIVAVSAGGHHTCAILATQVVSCWGRNDHHQIVDGTTKNNSHPSAQFGLTGVMDIVSSNDSSCVRLGRDAEIRCWGANTFAQLGDGTRVEHDVPMSARSPH